MTNLILLKAGEADLDGPFGHDPLWVVLLKALMIFVVLVLLNLASERVSFSKVIAATPGLRHADLLGRRKPAAG